MAYTIIKSDGTVLTTIADGTLNTTSTSISLPGRDYSGYGRYLDSNFVWMLENFANNTPPSNPIRGQLWFNTNDNNLYVCPADGITNPAVWIKLAVSQGNTSVTYDNITATGNIVGNNVSAVNSLTGNTVTGNTLTFTGNASVGNFFANGNISVGNTGVGSYANVNILRSVAYDTDPNQGIAYGTIVANAVNIGQSYAWRTRATGNATAGISSVTESITRGGTWQERMRITSEGALSILGNINAGNIFANSNITSNGGYFVSSNSALGYFLNVSGNNVGKLYYNAGAVKVEATDTTSNVQFAANSIVRLSVFANGLTSVNGVLGVGSTLSAGGEATIEGVTLIGNYNQILGSSSQLGIRYSGANVRYGVGFYPNVDNTIAATFFNSSNTVLGTISQTSNSVTWNGLLNANGNITATGNAFIGTNAISGNANNNSKITAGIFNTTSNVAVIPWETNDPINPPPPPGVLFSLNTVTVPLSVWLLTLNGSSANLSSLSGFTGVFVLTTSGNVSNYINLSPSSNLVLSMESFSNAIVFGAWHSDSSLPVNRLVNWSAVRLI
jgi:hypothetical protein